MAKPSVAYKESLVERLREHPEVQFEYLKAMLEDNHDMPEVILGALRDVAEARGFEKLAADAGLSQKALYKILKKEDAHPRFETIVQIFEALGVRLTLAPIKKRA